MRSLQLALLPLLVAACGGGRSVVSVTVEADGEVGGIAYLQVTVVSSGQTSKPLGFPMNGGKIPPAQTLSLSFVGDREGPIAVTVEAHDGANALLSTASATTTLKAGAATSLTVRLPGRAPADMTGTVVDAAVSDGTILDEAPPPDLVVPPDGMLPPDLVEPPDLVPPDMTECPAKCTVGGALKCVDPMTDPMNCGDCGKACAFGKNSTAQCKAGKCELTCDTDYADCNAMAADGCEKNLKTDPMACGDCAKVCPSGGNSKAECKGGMCELVCDVDFSDCNMMAVDGCEKNLKTDVMNCGACGNACKAGSNSKAACKAGKCELVCDEGFGDCNKTASDGCELNLGFDSSNCGACGRSCLGGNCLGTKCTPITLASGQPQPNSVVVAGGYVYWANVGTAASGLVDGGVKRVPIGGGAVTVVGGTNYPRTWYLAADATHVYWASQSGGTVMRAPHSTAVAQTVATGQEWATGVAVDSEYLYWTAMSANTVRRIKIADIGLGLPQTFATGQVNPLAIVSDGKQVFWLNLGLKDPGTDGGVMRAATATAKVEEIAKDQPEVRHISRDNTYVFWGTEGIEANNYLDGAVRKVPLTGLTGGGKVTDAAPAPQKWAQAVVSDGTYVYWVTLSNNGFIGTGQVFKMALAGGPVIELVGGENTPIAIAVDDKAVYWANRMSGTIMKAAK